MFNERMFVPKDLSMIFTIKEDIHVFNTNSIFPSLKGEQPMIKAYRNLSPIFSSCYSPNYIDFDCLLRFAEEHQLNKILIHNSHQFRIDLHKVKDFGKYSMYAF